MNACDEDIAKNVAESLLNHARSVYRYTASYCRDDEFNARFDDMTRATFKKHAIRLLRDLYGMTLLAKRNDVNKFCNMEQVEAYYEAGREILETNTGVANYSGLLN
jgi:hypothetical protein